MSDSDEKPDKKAKKAAAKSSGPHATKEQASEACSGDERLHVHLCTGPEGIDAGYVAAVNPRRALMHFAKSIGLKATAVDKIPTARSMVAMMAAMSPEQREEFQKMMAEQAQGRAASQTPQTSVSHQQEIVGSEPEPEKRERKGGSRGPR